MPFGSPLGAVRICPRRTGCAGSRSSVCWCSTPVTCPVVSRGEPVLRPVRSPHYRPAAAGDRGDRCGVAAAFWGRRVRRLLPALVTVLGGVTVLVWAVGRIGPAPVPAVSARTRRQAGGRVPITFAPGSPLYVQ